MARPASSSGSWRPGRGAASSTRRTSGALALALCLAAARLAPGRAERLAPGVNALNVADPLREELAFDVDPTTYLTARERAK